MSSHPRCACAPFHTAMVIVLMLALAASLPLVSASRVRAQDYQLVAQGNGRPDIDCVVAGTNGFLETTKGGDDVLISGLQVITTGPNGICETPDPLAGDDQRPANGVIFGQGLPNAPIILSGTPGLNDDGICNDALTPAGDDVTVTAPGTSVPRMRAIRAGTNGTIDSTIGGDDASTTVICPGVDNVLQSASVLGGDDLIVTVSPLCGLCAGSAGCIIPGTNDGLETSVDPADEAKNYVSTGVNGIAQTTATGDDFQEIALNRGSPDTICINAGADGIAQTVLCGNGIADDEENGIAGSDCDDGNLTPGDGCNALCRAEFCGDGIVQAGLGEECEDGNTRNDDACVLGCKNALCGDGFLHRDVEGCEPPNTATCDALCQRITTPCPNGVLDAGEECDDGNGSNRDDCTGNCTMFTCGDGFLHTKGTPPFEECDDGNLTPGDGCSPTCTNECGNGVIDGACSQGNVGASCTTDADCDQPPASGNGRCAAEECDPGAANLCVPGPLVCSNVCRIAECGNAEVECQEQCDLGSANGVSGSGCTLACARNVIGRNETSSSRECPNAWTLDSAGLESPPRDLAQRKQVCQDGAACDFDGTGNGACHFHVGVCLNRSGVPGCTSNGIVTFDLARLARGANGFYLPTHAAAAEDITAAVAGLAPSGGAEVPGRCRDGLSGKLCSDDAECDRFFGAGDGACDIGTGVQFTPPLVSVNLGGPQVMPCTTSQEVVVPAGSAHKFFAIVGRIEGGREKDSLRLVCQP